MDNSAGIAKEKIMLDDIGLEKFFIKLIASISGLFILLISLLLLLYFKKFYKNRNESTFLKKIFYL